MLNLGRSEKGFTLIEVMVSLCILAVLSVLTAQAMKSAVDNKASLTAELDRDQKLADTLRVMRNDISNAFHYRDTNVQMLNEIVKPTPVGGGAGPGGGPGGFGNAAAVVVPVSPLGTPRPTPVQTTNFVGSNDALYLTTTTNVRTVKDSQESDLAKVGYFLKSCKGVDGKGGSNCLYRSSSPLLDDDVTKPGDETELVDHVEEFKLRYLGPDHEDYVTKWATDKTGDDSTKDVFPYAVEVTLTLVNKQDKKDRPVTGTILVPINFPNNAKKPAGASTTDTDVTKK